MCLQNTIITVAMHVKIGKHINIHEFTTHLFFFLFIYLFLVYCGVFCELYF